MTPYYICNNLHPVKRENCPACGEQFLPELDPGEVRARLETEVATVARALREAFPSIPRDEDGQVDYAAIAEVALSASSHVGWIGSDPHAAVWIDHPYQSSHVTVQGWLGDEGETLVETLPVEVWS